MTSIARPSSSHFLLAVIALLFVGLFPLAATATEIPAERIAWGGMSMGMFGG